MLRDCGLRILRTTSPGDPVILSVVARPTPHGPMFAVEVDGVDALADFGLTGATVKAGAYIVVPSGDAITAITMSSGSVIIYNQ